MTLEIPNYRVIERIGTGAATAIYRARCVRTGRDYAIKTMKVRAPEDMKIIDSMRDEYNVGSQMDHPVIRKVYEFRLIRQRLRVRGALLFMEYVPGVSMSDKDFKPSLQEVLRLFAIAAEGLAAMHRVGFVHADLKPGNMIVTPYGNLKLIDLGQSFRLGQAKQRVQGTIDYMAPEQALRETIDQRTDVFGLGATLHRVLTGKPVPTEMNQTVNPHSHRLLGKRVEEIPQPILTELPVSVARLIEDCCETNPADRPQDITAVMQRLEMALAIVSKPPTEDMIEGREDDESYLDEHEEEFFMEEDPSGFLDTQTNPGEPA